MATYQSSFTGAQIDAAVGGAVRFDVAQTKTDAQKAQAQSNIGMPNVLSDIDALSIEELIKLSDSISTGKYIDKYGALVDATSGGSNYEATDYVDVSAYKNVAITASSYTNRMYYAFYDENKAYISGSGRAYESNVVLRDEIVSVPATAKYCVAMWYYSVSTNDPIIKGVATRVNPEGFVQYEKSQTLSDEQKTTARKNIGVDDFVSKVVGKNLLNLDAMVSGYINNSSGNISASTSYSTTDFIPIASGQKIVFNTRIRKFLAYDSSKAAITSTYLTNETSAGYVYTASANGYIRASYYNTDLASAQIEYGEVSTSYQPYRKQVESNIYLSTAMEGQVNDLTGNVLTGKKWVACGDSFTAGDFTDSPTSDFTFASGKYKGRNKVYPYWIGQRNIGMDVINEAISGSTMGGGEHGNNPFSGTRYQNIPSDADYITLMFGINDGSRGVPIGTIDDDDNTTFYGAWNVVLDYLTTNFPFAHIGIIVGAGMQDATTYAEAEIAVAKKWGIPYLNIQFESGESMPLMLRTSNPNVSATVKALRNSQQYVNTSTNHHPNANAHELESTFIEAFLKRI